MPPLPPSKKTSTKKLVPTALRVKRVPKGATLALVIFAAVIGTFGMSSAAAAPSAPSGLTASSTQNSITLSWQAPSGAATYTLWQDDVWKGTNVSTSYTFTGLSCGTTYKLKVAAYDASWNL